MNTDLVEIACIVDRSGSMMSIADDAIGGFNAFLESQKAETGSAKLTLVLFDHEYEVVHGGADLQSVPPLDDSTYQPRGTTALLDAVGRTIDDIGKRLADTQERNRPHKVIFAILTDGMENASRDYSYEKIASMIEHQRDVYGWEFLFLAANQDAIAAGGKMSIHAADAMSFNATGEGVRAAYASMSASVSERRAPRRKR